VPEAVSGEVGFLNEGYWGIPVDNGSYTTGFHVKGDYDGEIRIRLTGNASQTDLGSTSIDIRGNSSAFTYYSAEFDAEEAPDGNNVWCLTFNGSAAAGKTFYFTLMSLTPQTFNDR
jgi:alpha-N-arabinofuranosidase